jgi:GT2 family glycosyltransferase
VRNQVSAGHAGILHIHAPAGAGGISQQQSAPVHGHRPVLTVVIPVRNDPDRLQRCLQSIRAAAGGQAVDVIVVDNGSTDDTAQVALASGARVLSHPDLPVGELRNRGARAATTELLAFVDADHELLDGWYEAALEVLSDPKVGAAGAMYHPPDDRTWVQEAYDTLRQHTLGRHDVEWLGAGNLVVRRSAFVAVRGFDPTLEACEDVDLCRSLIHAGWRIVSDSRMRNVHHGDPATLGRVFVSELWRGRNNLAVTLRRPVQMRSLISLALALLQLLALSALIAGGLATPVRPHVGGLLAVSGAALFLGPTALRAARMWRRLSVKTIRGFWDVLQVAVTYDAARALALAYRAGHHRASTPARRGGTR